ncbi:alcohol dehydrogenase catalytic domain-containing protein, partial [Spirillospora sp. NPDC049652]
MSSTMRAVRAVAAGKPFEAATLPVPEPGPGQVRVKVHACGVCGGDAVARFDALGLGLPRTPGHEVAGVVDAAGDGPP